MNVDSLENEDKAFFHEGTTLLSLPSPLEAIRLESASLQDRERQDYLRFRLQETPYMQTFKDRNVHLSVQSLVGSCIYKIT